MSRFAFTTAGTPTAISEAGHTQRSNIIQLRKLMRSFTGINDGWSFSCDAWWGWEELEARHLIYIQNKYLSRKELRDIVSKLRRKYGCA